MPAFEDLVAAFEWVSSDPTGENSAYVNRVTGQVHWTIDATEFDEEMPEDIEDGSKYIAVPRKHDLDLGKVLVMKFTQEYLPQEASMILSFFRTSGAYGKFKRLLEKMDILQVWYEYEKIEIEISLRQWATENHLKF